MRFRRRRVQVDLVGGPGDGRSSRLDVPVMPDALLPARLCAGCGHFHPADGEYRRVGTPAAGLPGQFLWVPTRAGER